MQDNCGEKNDNENDVNEAKNEMPPRTLTKSFAFTVVSVKNY
jgi:hypothetical protein